MEEQDFLNVLFVKYVIQASRMVFLSSRSVVNIFWKNISYLVTRYISIESLPGSSNLELILNTINTKNFL